MARPAAWLFVLLAPLLASCSGSDDSDSTGFAAGTTCGLDLQTSGAAALSVSPSASVACLTEQSSGPGISVAFILTEGAVEATSLEVTVDKAQTGKGFEARVGVTPRNAAALEAAGCVADITGNERARAVEFGEQYRVTGEMRDDGRNDPGEDPITIERLRFVASITWTD